MATARSFPDAISRPDGSVTRVRPSWTKAKSRAKLLLLEFLTTVAAFLAIGTMGFLEHLDELRRRLIFSLIALGVAFALCFTFAENIFLFLMEPLRAALPEGASLIATSVPEIFLLYMKMAFFAAIFLASPFVLTQVWLFVSPGLHEHEKRLAIPFVFFGTFFFLVGAAFAHYIVFPYSAKFLVGFGGGHVGIMLSVAAVFSFYSKFVLGMGLVFEIPTLVFALSKLGIVTSRYLWKNFKYGILIIFSVAAVITPTGDPATLCLVAVPMVALYLLSIGIAWIVGLGEEKRN